MTVPLEKPTRRDLDDNRVLATALAGSSHRMGDRMGVCRCGPGDLPKPRNGVRSQDSSAPTSVRRSPLERDADQPLDEFFQ